MPPPKIPEDASGRNERPEPREGESDRLLQKSESMAREHSQKREMKIRSERVRHLSSSEPDPQALQAAASPTPGGGSSRREPSSSSSRNAPSGRVAAPTGRAAMISERIPEAPASENRSNSGALEVREVRESRGLGRDGPEPRESRPNEPILIGRPSMVDDVAIELEDLLREAITAWRRSEIPDRITIVSAVLTLVGVLLPWTSDPSHPFQLGITSGGVVHAALAITALVLLGQRGSNDRRGLGSAIGSRGGMARRELDAKARRTSLWHILIGSLSTFVGAYFLLTYGLMRTPEYHIHIHFGLYWTLAWGLGLSYGGFARFLKRPTF
jgi:hypothetical protein